MSRTTVESIYTCPTLNTSTTSISEISSPIPIGFENMKSKHLNTRENLDGDIKEIDVRIKKCDLDPVSTTAFPCLLELHEYSPLSSEPFSPDSIPETNGVRHVTKTCSSIIPSLLIENPDAVLYTSENADLPRRASKAYQTFLVEDQPITFRTRSLSYQEKYSRYMDKIAGIDMVGLNRLSDEALGCLESYLGPCYRKNGEHFINSYQKRIKQEKMNKRKIGLPSGPKLVRVTRNESVQVAQA
ncbi:uncharacterized protein MELLADRAFT_112456 [Melampsora larici-populina 98AG31]|uniref:Uncharacterized protein n=1 Tax=Melampsora larici-populina (strain 98AG31 / pathotype 3-4-7) TaxID=747676 RepID=F4S6J3_MELLP|nr:uncharacterized protein MELLADRAFT_112456 [Melampsora larici-populina 98AG31]EGF99749.1 hypothetical protein MELLADRAFT_112456 [Melampsora larici-populina 98AG31]